MHFRTLAAAQSAASRSSAVMICLLGAERLDRARGRGGRHAVGGCVPPPGGDRAREVTNTRHVEESLGGAT